VLVWQIGKTAAGVLYWSEQLAELIESSSSSPLVEALLPPTNIYHSAKNYDTNYSRLPNRISKADFQSPLLNDTEQRPPACLVNIFHDVSLRTAYSHELQLHSSQDLHARCFTAARIPFFGCSSFIQRPQHSIFNIPPPCHQQRIHFPNISDRYSLDGLTRPGRVIEGRNIRQRI
jgi:hypothetical protein